MSSQTTRLTLAPRAHKMLQLAGMPEHHGDDLLAGILNRSRYLVFPALP
jgi:hypothetical protein